MHTSVFLKRDAAYYFRDRFIDIEGLSVREIVKRATERTVVPNEEIIAVKWEGADKRLWMYWPATDYVVTDREVITPIWQALYHYPNACSDSPHVQPLSDFD